MTTKMFAKTNLKNGLLVIAHRGASGYRPENTLAAFELGLSQGADGIEFDVVSTSDQKLIVRHENALSGTTNISGLVELQSRKRAGLVEGAETSDWFTEDFTLAEIQQLHAIERIPELRPGSKKFDGEFTIPTLTEVLAIEGLGGKKVVLEIKSGTHLEKLTTPIEVLVSDDIQKSNCLGDLVIESFDFDILRATQKELTSRSIQAQYFLLLEECRPKEIDISGFDGISVSLEMLFSNDDWVGFAQSKGKQIWAYTARVEESESTVEAYYERIIQTGVDGIFADQPDLLRRVLDERGGSTYDY